MNQISCLVNHVRVIRGVDHISALEMEEESVILAEQYLLEDVVAFDHIKVVHDVEIAAELIDSLV